MILDHLSNAALYQFANPLIQRGLEFLKSTPMASLPLGRTDIDGDRLLAINQEYPTKPLTECFWEAHRKYIDIQYMISGQERIDYAPIDSLEIAVPYDAAKDRAELTGAGSSLELSAGMFAIFYPHDAHRPCVQAMESARVKKIVLKAAVE